MILFTFVGIAAVAAVAGCGIYFCGAVAFEWLSEHFNLHWATPWRIGSDRTGRSFTVRCWGTSFVLRSGRPTRGFFYMKSDRT